MQLYESCLQQLVVVALCQRMLAEQLLNCSSTAVRTAAAVLHTRILTKSSHRCNRVEVVRVDGKNHSR